MNARLARLALATFALSSIVQASIAQIALAQDRPPHGRPPQEALDACARHSSGDACSFTGRGGESVEGTCRAPEGRALACAPAQGPGGHPPVPPEALEACEDTDVGDACVVQTPRGVQTGTCRTTPEGAACLPTHPPRAS